MNGRIEHEETPWGRVAAVARSLCIQMEKRYKETGCGPSAPDYADFRDVFEPFIKRELIKARIDEVRKMCGIGLTERVKEFAGELAALKYPEGFEL